MCGMGGAWHDYPQRLRARRAAGKRQQGDIARTLDGHAQPALVARTNASHAARQNFAALLDELRQDVRALVVDEVHLLDAELTDFLLAEILTLSARTPPWAARSAATWSAFAPRTTVSSSVAAMTTGAAFASRRSARGSCLFLFLCHTFHPFPGAFGIAEVAALVTRSIPVTGSRNKNS